MGHTSRAPMIRPASWKRKVLRSLVRGRGRGRVRVRDSLRVRGRVRVGVRSGLA